MTTAKVSLTIDGSLLAEARTNAGRRGLSSYVNDALRRQLQRDRLRALLDEMSAEAGPVDPAVMEEVRRAWPAPAEAADASRRGA